MPQDDNYDKLVEQYLDDPRTTLFPGDAFFSHFDDTTILVDELVFFLDDADQEKKFTIVSDALSFWKDLTDYIQRHADFPLLLWKALPFDSTEIIQQATNWIEPIIKKKLDSIQDICSSLVLDYYRRGEYNQKEAMTRLDRKYERELDGTAVNEDNSVKAAILYRIKQLINGGDAHTYRFYEKSGEDLIQDWRILCERRAARNEIRIVPQNTLSNLVKSAHVFFEKFESRYSKTLNGGKPFSFSDKQKAAIVFNPRFSLVRSSAGSGKTTVLIARFFYLIEVQGMSPADVLFLVYSKNVCNEINTKIHSLWTEDYGHFSTFWPSKDFAQDKVPGPAKTFHGAALDVIGQVTQGTPTIEDFENHEKLLDIRTCVLENCLTDEMVKERLSGSDFYRFFSQTYLPFAEERQRKQEENITDFPGSIEWANTLMEKELSERAGLKTFRHILVDEYQDITKNRHRFLVNLVRCGPKTCLFAVGDDWQSIYSFTESDLTLFLDFQVLWGKDAYIYDLDETFRFGEPLVTLSNQFVQKQEATHLTKKSIKGDGETAMEFVPYQHHYHEDNNPIITNLKEQFEIICDRIEGIYKSSDPEKEYSIAIINRYNLPREYNFDKFRTQIQNVYPNIRLEFVTMHSSKGETYDYTFVVNCNKKTVPLLKIDYDDFRHLLRGFDIKTKTDEERRLFYVAITRARKKVFLLYDTDNPSPFIQELELLSTRFHHKGQKI